jgi:2,5-diamino-6-(ribosylamino)-4(3H)-pyrimidinone 5'-phosphate reductase
VEHRSGRRGATQHERIWDLGYAALMLAKALPRPYVVVHVAVSVDGATTGFEVDVQRYYSYAGTWHEDVTLTGADTILAQQEQLALSPKPGPATQGPLLAVVDSRSRVRTWAALRDCGFWRDVVALRSAASSVDGGDVLRCIVHGTDRVDLVAALEELHERDGARLVRVDSGGQLIGALLNQGLVDEVSLLIHPGLSHAANRWYGRVPPPAAALRLLSSESVGDDILWLRYRVGDA